MSHVVKALQLNLRSEADPSRQNVIAVLPQGTRVEKLADAPRPSWWRVRAHKGGATLEGYLHAGYLEPEETVSLPQAQAPAGTLPACEFPPSTTSTRARAGGWASPLGEPGHPGRPSSHPGGAVAGVHALVDWLDVENPAHLRWQRKGATTYCNIYAYDLAHACGAYLPRVWWTDKALQKLRAGETVAVQYGITATEMAANYIFNWFEEHGEDFGWSRLFDVDDLQAQVNQGAIGIVCAQRTMMNRPGHIQGILPEFGDRRALRKDGKVRLPLQSNAGTRNFNAGFLTNTHWWQSSNFRDFGFWIHPLG